MSHLLVLSEADVHELLTLPECKHISNLKRMDEESRDMVFRMAEMLAERQVATHKAFIEGCDEGSSQGRKK